MHYLKAEHFTYLAGEINALYHDAAVKWVFQTAFKIFYM